MMTSDDKVGGWVKKGQNHDDVILEWSLSETLRIFLFLPLEEFRRDIVLLTLSKRFKTDYQYIETLRVAQSKSNDMWQYWL